VTPLTSEVAVTANPGVTAWTTVANVALSGVTAGSKEVWDGARLRLRWAHTLVGSADGTQLRLTAVALTASYTTTP
jgi:hypothetical protein